MGNVIRSRGVRELVVKSRVVASAVTAVAVFSLVFAVPASAASGTWTVVASPSPGPANSLNAVSCVTSRWCVAVGIHDDAVAEVERTLAETWDGTRWQIVPSPNVGAFNNVLYGVSCVTARSCIAVGSSYEVTPKGPTLGTLVEHWDGRTWTVIPSPTPGSGGYFTAVSCATARSCVAVGIYGGTEFDLTLAEIWDGTTWTVAATPSLPAAGNLLLGVSCATTRSCVAVGTYTPLRRSARALAETWDGRIWKPVASPNVGVSGNALFGVSCTTARSCLAVGEDGHTLVETWNGTSWTPVPSPNPRSSGAGLLAVSCASRRSCVAAGVYRDPTQVAERTLVETWDGTAVTIDPSPSPSPVYNYLNGVSCPTRRACVAVGNVVHVAGGRMRTLVMSKAAHARR